MNYSVSVSDGDHPNANEDLSSLVVSADYLEGLDQAEADQGHKIMTEAMMGKSLFSSLTCKTCHKENETSIGPSFTAIAQKYSDKDIPYLKNKIVQGGTGVWGETAMPANPDIPESDLNALVSYILSLDQVSRPSLPASGSVDPTQGKPATPTGMLMLSASYTDNGGENIKPLTGFSSVILRSNTIDMGTAVDLEGGYSSMAYDGANLLMVPKNKASFAINNVDLTDIGSVTVMGVVIGKLGDQYDFEIRTDSPTGELIGEGTYTEQPSKGPEGAPNYAPVTIPVKAVTDGKMHKIYIITTPKNDGGGATFVLPSVTFNAN